MSAPAELLTIRDFLRYAVSRFREAQLVHGHGVTNAYDEAAFIVLEGLHLPIDQLEPWTDARLTAPERERLAGLIEARITTRKPACYLLNKAYIQGIPFYVDERVIIPRSYLGELLSNGLFGDAHNPSIPDSTSVSSVLDLCTGSGCLAIIAAHIFENASIDAVDLSSDALEVAKINLDLSQLSNRITLHQSNLFSAIPKRKFDIIISNPPYVTAEEVFAFPPEFAAEPEMAHLGGTDGMDLVRQILRESPNHLTKNGGLLCEIGLGREIIEAEFPHIPFLWLDTEESEGEVFWVRARDF